MSRFCSPLRYPGGKNCIFPFVSQLFYENNLLGAAYAEPYAGGAGLALRLLFEEYVDRIYINDLDRSIYAFWSSVLAHPDAFCSWIEDVDVSIDSWYKYKEIQKNVPSVELLELAKSTFFLNRTNVSGVIKGGVIGGFEQKGNYKIDVRFKKKDLINRIQKIARFKNRISISNLDGLAFVKKMDSKSENVFIYLDPPYYQKGADLYMNFYSKSDHEKLSEHVHKMKKKWMVSYDNHDFILNLYAAKNKVRYKLSQSTSNRVGDEVLIFSKDLSFNQSIQSLSSPVCL
jgi:DNA adenine methylase